MALTQNLYKFPILSMYIKLYIQIFMDQGSFILLRQIKAYLFPVGENKNHPSALIFFKIQMRIYKLIWYGLTHKNSVGLEDQIQ